MKKRMWYLRNFIPTRHGMVWYVYSSLTMKKKWIKKCSNYFRPTKTPKTKKNYLKNVARCGVCFVGEINVTLARTSSRLLFWKTYTRTHTHARTRKHWHTITCFTANESNVRHIQFCFLVAFFHSLSRYSLNKFSLIIH